MQFQQNSISWYLSTPPFGHMLFVYGFIVNCFVWVECLLWTDLAYIWVAAPGMPLKDQAQPIIIIIIINAPSLWATAIINNGENCWQRVGKQVNYPGLLVHLSKTWSKGEPFFCKANIALRYQLMRFSHRVSCYKDVCLSPALQLAVDMQQLNFFFCKKTRRVSKIAGQAAIQFFKKSSLGQFSRGKMWFCWW